MEEPEEQRRIAQGRKRTPYVADEEDEDDEEDYYFEFRIQVDEITKDVSLTVTDYSDEDELEEAKLLWNSLIADLKQVLGST